MKLCRVGDIGNEKPAIIDKDNNYRDLSSLITDFNPETLNFDGFETQAPILVLDSSLGKLEKSVLFIFSIVSKFNVSGLKSVINDDKSR